VALVALVALSALAALAAGESDMSLDAVRGSSGIAPDVGWAGALGRFGPCGADRGRQGSVIVGARGSIGAPTETPAEAGVEVSGAVGGPWGVYVCVVGLSVPFLELRG